MIHEIEIQNLVTNEKINIGSEGSYIIENLNWDSPSTTIDSYRVPFQIGETFLGVTIGTRKPLIIGYVIADNVNWQGLTWKQYYEEQERDIEQKKLDLDRLISVNQELRIKANDYYLDCRATQPPKYSNNVLENNEVLCMFELEFECFNPLFYSETKYAELATVNEVFRFPLIIPQNEGIIFSEMIRRQSVRVTNNGSVDCGCIITVKANGGSVTNPSVYNVNTGEFIKFENVILNDGDVLTINTLLGEENAVVHRIETSEDEKVIGNIVSGSSFIQIKQGVSYYAYSVDAGSASVEVLMTYQELYFNIRGI